MNSRPRLIPVFLYGLAMLLATTSAAGQLEKTVAVPVQVVSAQDLADGPSCGRTLLDITKIPPAPALNISRGSVRVPESANNSLLLDSLRVRSSDGRIQPASDLLCFENIEVLKSPMDVLYGDSVAGTINFITSGSSRSSSPGSNSYATNFFAEPLLNPGQLQILRGPFDGMGTGTSIDVGGKPGLILAETPQSLFWLLPENIEHGSLTITLIDAGRGARFPVYVLGLAMSADRLQLLRGESTKMQATIFGPELIPPEGWNAGDVSSTIDLKKVSEFFPDFKIPKPGEPGTIFFRLDNASRETVSMRPSKNETFRINLKRTDFGGGPYTYNGMIQSKKAGGFVVNGMVVAFFAPIPGQPFSPEDVNPPQPPQPESTAAPGQPSRK
ncbi:MAG: hypothetical protein AB7O65_14735 [Candidatus Korobacteraceae bacterium]